MSEDKTSQGKKKWREMSLRRKFSLAVLGIVQFSLLIAALWDLQRRPEEAIRGKKWVWRLLVFVNWIGPLSYFKFGRTKTA